MAKKLVSSMDRHGRILIPSKIREMLHIHPGDKINLEISENEVRIINANKIIDEMHALFTKNQTSSNGSIVDDFINQKREDYKIEEARSKRNDK